MGHYQTIRFQAPLNEFAIKLMNYLAQDGVDWGAAADVLWPYEKVIRTLWPLLPLQGGPFPFLAQRKGDRIVIDGEYKWGSWRPDPAAAWKEGLPFLIAEPAGFFELHELWDNAHITQIQPTPPTSAHASEIAHL